MAGQVDAPTTAAAACAGDPPVEPGVSCKASSSNRYLRTKRAGFCVVATAWEAGLATGAALPVWWGTAVKPDFARRNDRGNVQAVSTGELEGQLALGFENGQKGDGGLGARLICSICVGGVDGVFPRRVNNHAVGLCHPSLARGIRGCLARRAAWRSPQRVKVILTGGRLIGKQATVFISVTVLAVVPEADCEARNRTLFPFGRSRARSGGNDAQWCCSRSVLIHLTKQRIKARDTIILFPSVTLQAEQQIVDALRG